MKGYRHVHASMNMQYRSVLDIYAYVKGILYRSRPRYI